jgi:hypothetical protein
LKKKDAGSGQPVEGDTDNGGRNRRSGMARTEEEPVPPAWLAGQVKMMPANSGIAKRLRDEF